ncbi:MAG: hypothetical protein KGJ57_17310 [Sphingomonadales bacterium]|nr:hypothetical protein [Sphingomonadales bacterium]MDE2171156.1 hypothetical protein [Sphingomonadales bacterium]
MRPTHLLDAAGLGYAIKPVCECGHSVAFDPMGLWWHFERRGWDDHLPKVRLRFWCVMCRSKLRRKVRPIRLEVVDISSNDFTLPRPDERTWKKYSRSLR